MRQRNPKDQDVADSHSHMSSESSDSSLSAVCQKSTPPKGQTGLALEMDTDQSGSPRKPVLKKRRLSARAILCGDTNNNNSQKDRKIVCPLKIKHCVSIESEGSTDSEGSSNEGDSAFLDGLEGQSQATYADGAFVDNDQAAPHDSIPVDWPASLVLRFESPTEEKLDGLSDGKQFDVIMACHEEAMRSQEVTEQMPVRSNVEFPQIRTTK